MNTHDYRSISGQIGLILLLTSSTALTASICLYEQTASIYYKVFAAGALLLIGISLDILKNSFNNYRRRKQLRPLQIEPELPLQYDLNATQKLWNPFKFFKSRLGKSTTKTQIELSNGHLINLRADSHK
ncbi:MULTISPECIES: hypothetical protein [unclassified Lentimonas]|uniref:hypothetical protein n=1 Tax=unclassified Lentimonas TaxID=2630993 RepID=UPI001328EF4F|nr:MULTISPECIES: hypothetical protein [unclassified Lentimonas]CAA6678881.1 Unannotated [Lentimonas sp. CC4]CAA6684485.1 Unannotated [Lentimonas sp. CC6]CAA6692752.1 Unannotated [Lentimonas sp. CC19]CAA6695100.1 Unannotated [Lentimonas sp. CC10]CAA7069684.1 Unannotated [Lentimonas sp. CC11]